MNKMASQYQKKKELFEELYEAASGICETIGVLRDGGYDCEEEEIKNIKSSIKTLTELKRKL